MISHQLRAGGNKNQRVSNELCQSLITVITPGQTGGVKHSDSNQIIRPHTGKQITFREQLDHVWSGHLPCYSELEICEGCVFDQWSLFSLALSRVVMLVMARRWHHNGGRGRDMEDTPRMEINDLHVSRVSSHSQSSWQRLRDLWQRDRVSQADTGNGSLVGAQLGNYSQRFNSNREHKTKNANHCGSKIDFFSHFIWGCLF